VRFSLTRYTTAPPPWTVQETGWGKAADWFPFELESETESWPVFFVVRREGSGKPSMTLTLLHLCFPQPLARLARRFAPALRTLTAAFSTMIAPKSCWALSARFQQAARHHFTRCSSSGPGKEAKCGTRGGRVRNGGGRGARYSVSPVSQDLLTRRAAWHARVELVAPPAPLP